MTKRKKREHTKSHSEDHRAQDKASFASNADQEAANAGQVTGEPEEKVTHPDVFGMIDRTNTGTGGDTHRYTRTDAGAGEADDTTADYTTNSGWGSGLNPGTSANTSGEQQ